jgi:hypothetical protein
LEKGRRIYREEEGIWMLERSGSPGRLEGSGEDAGGSGGGRGFGGRFEFSRRRLHLFVSVAALAGGRVRLNHRPAI